MTPKQEAARPWNIFTGYAGRAARGVSLADGVRRLAYAAHEGGRPGGIRPHRRQRLQRPRSSVTGARRHIKKVFRHDNIHRCVRPTRASGVVAGIPARTCHLRLWPSDRPIVRAAAEHPGRLHKRANLSLQLPPDCLRPCFGTPRGELIRRLTGGLLLSALWNGCAALLPKFSLSDPTRCASPVATAWQRTRARPRDRTVAIPTSVDIPQAPSHGRPQDDA